MENWQVTVERANDSSETLPEKYETLAAAKTAAEALSNYFEDCWARDLPYSGPLSEGCEIIVSDGTETYLLTDGWERI